ncbi:heavy metal translocating P-type ATPase [Nubsella zeaxanthinifaciens]|uniref:heavy metal translocating P-type ATPase n=1 Tax=Nubsella zeaxanthinifaciens TaxID=392412 RepID=UPI003CFDCA4A
MKHQHKQIQADTDCCSTSHRNPTNVKHSEHHHNHEDDDGHNHDHDASDKSKLQLFLPAIVSFSLLVVGLVLDHLIHPTWFQGWVRLALYLAAYLPVGIPVLKDALYSISKGDIFSEFFLMGIATLGAFAIKEYPEGVAVMLFYAVGEVFQTLAVTKAKGNIKALLDQRPDEVTVLINGVPQLAKAKTVALGSIIQLKPGEKLALDGELISESAAFNTAALTGESKPDTKKKGNLVLAGMINLNTPSQLKVTATYEDSKLSKILELVQNATTQKSTTELFIRRFAKVYTPIVVFLALSICLLPYFFVANYVFVDWLYKALIFLVISCPCALVISIPLGYFGGIGAASRNGILFKGGNFIDILANIKQVVMDKTGTLTAGVFKVQQATILDGFDRTELLKWVNALESNSTHPVATAIRNFVGEVDHSVTLHEVEEIAGHGLKASINGKPFLVGNFRLMDKFNISYNKALSDVIYTVIAIAYDGKFAGYLTIADNIKPDAPRAIKLLQQLGINVTMLSGDKTSVVNDVAKQLGIKQAFGDLLPEDKVEKVKELKNRGLGVAFVGDGVNDAPVVALSDVGIAMGGLGSDATVEAADVVVQDDMPSRIPVAIQISKQTKRIVWQNIALAFGVKAIVLILGAGGLATMWEAVFADVGVALAAILNAVRIQRMEF